MTTDVSADLVDHDLQPRVNCRRPFDLHWRKEAPAWPGDVELAYRRINPQRTADDLCCVQCGSRHEDSTSNSPVVLVLLFRVLMADFDGRGLQCPNNSRRLLPSAIHHLLMAVSESLLSCAEPAFDPQYIVQFCSHTAYIPPPQSTASQHYHLRRCTQDRQLPTQISHLCNKNFLRLALYKDCY